MEYKHFSHNHTLTLHKVQPGQQFQCHGCHSQCNDSIFACWTCNFFLHEHCGNANRYVKHPCHPPHPLVLMPGPTYCSSSFLCNGCGAPGSSFSYSCPLCEVDLHIPCAYLPHKVKHHNHIHDIRLALKASDKKMETPQYCKICSKELGSKYWLYYCDKPECDFRVHTFCATTEVQTGLYQDDELDQIPAAAPPPQDALADMFQIQMQLQLNQMFK